VLTATFALASPVHAEDYLAEKFKDTYSSYVYWIFGWIFRLLCGVVFTLPTWIFTSHTFFHIFSLVSILSISLIGVKALWHGITTGVGKGSQSDKDVTQIVGWLALSMFGIGLLPMGLQTATYIINRITLSIGKIGFSEMTNVADITSLGSFVETYAYQEFDILAMLIFDIMLIWQAIPLLFQAGQRWVNMAALGVVGPLALSSFVFNDTKHYGHMWWNSIKRMGLVQIWQVAFCSLLLLLMFGAKEITGASDVFVKILMLIGGLRMLKSPPGFIVRDRSSSVGRKVQKAILGKIPGAGLLIKGGKAK
jgi:hypothetical protein